LTFSTTQKGGSIAWLGSSEDGPASGTGTITYTDGTSAAFTLALSDWTLGGGSGAQAPGNVTALTTTARNLSGGSQQALNVYLFYTSTPLDATKTVASVTLPGQVSSGLLHVFSYVLAP
jgi:hypothetical protein